ncbi:DNA methyltransferase [Maribacter dokdonensis]|uniref:DNA methyltransferase n=1 Tax=Maribacter dokdonensis TaxID=320912 RepID=UPI002AB0083E|nr:DNA methyltransferase [Maribacter dokdonensis]
MVNNDFELNNKGTSNACDTRSLARHRWYFYKEGFSPSLVNKAIEESEITENDIILDPFNGSGTVTLTAAIRGINTIGFEVNPFTSFLSDVKSINFTQKNFKKVSDEVLKNSEIGGVSHLENYSTFTENKHKGQNQWLFNKAVLDSFAGGFNNLGTTSKSSKLAKLALVSAIMNNSNAKKDGKCLRYKSNWENLNYDKYSFLESLEKNFNIIEKDLENRVKTKPNIKTGDSRKLIKKLNSKFKLCITSPPYLNTFDYTDIYRPELFLSGFINSSEELRKLRYETVRSHVQVRWNKPKLNDFGIHFNDVFKKISDKRDLLMHKNIPDMISAYFEDMQGIFIDLKQKADTGASLWFVVSTSAYANEHIPVDLILADIATKVGWKLKEIGVLREIHKRKTRFSPDIDKLRESVIILNN